MSKRFIEIQSFGNRHLINLDSLRDIEECEAGCELIFVANNHSYQSTILADESYEVVKRLIEEAEK